MQFMDKILPIHLLRRVFRGKFVAALRQAFQEGQLNFHGNLTCLSQLETFAAWLRPLFRKDWVVYSKPPFGGPEYVPQYLGRYTHHVAISNHRLVSLNEGKVTFRWRDSAPNNEQKLISAPPIKRSRHRPESMPSAESTSYKPTRSIRVLRSRLLQLRRSMSEPITALPPVTHRVLAKGARRTLV
jgi:hypothetical protein